MAFVFVVDESRVFWLQDVAAQPKSDAISIEFTVSAIRAKLPVYQKFRDSGQTRRCLQLMGGVGLKISMD